MNLQFNADRIVDRLDLNEYFSSNSNSTILIKIHEDSYSNYGIYAGDVLVVDTTIKPQNNMRLLVSLYDNLTIKRYKEIDGKPYLQDKHNKMLPLQIGDDIKFEIIGGICGIIDNYCLNVDANQ